MGCGSGVGGVGGELSECFMTSLEAEILDDDDDDDDINITARNRHRWMGIIRMFHDQS